MFNKMFSSFKDDSAFSRTRNVVFYGRVSTEHEEQTYALKNQMQWYDELCKQYHNWNVVDRYVDDGVSGTKAKKRPEFMRMLAEAKSGKFDLIVTREVSRFARNTVECLEITRQLKEIGVEVFFVHEGIWTLDNSGEMILTIMAMVAQEESRKMSERVKAGQAISRQNGVLYGNGNILGYDRVDGTYVINEEQASTVRLIYNLYEAGMGMHAIRNELIRLGEKNAKGGLEWDVTRISRCLHNSVYKGVMAYNKSHRNNFLDQKSIKNNDEDTFIYMDGDFEPIISPEQWERCKHIRESRKRVQAIKKDGQISVIKVGSNKKGDVWTHKLRCSCGSSMRKDKWHTRINGKASYGYRCYNQLNRGVQNKSEAEAGFCDQRSVCDWKLEMMGLFIFRRLFNNKDIFNAAAMMLKAENYMAKQERERIRSGYEIKIKKLNEKLARLLEMRADGELDKETYLAMKGATEADKDQAQQELLSFDRVSDDNGFKDISDADIKSYLKNSVSAKNTTIDPILIEKFVSRIQIDCETQFTWRLSFGPELTGSLQFKIPYKEALKYRKLCGSLLRENQYSNLCVSVYY